MTRPTSAAPRSCEALGPCQHQDPECPGDCERIPVLPVWFADEEPIDPYGPATLVFIWVCIALLSLVSLALVSMGVGYSYARWGADIEAAYRSAADAAWALAGHWF